MHNEAYLKSLGATHVIDRKSPLSDLPAAVKTITVGPVKVILDIISEPETQIVSYQSILAPGGCLLISSRPAVEESKMSPEKDVSMVYGDAEEPSQRELGAALYRNLTALFEAGDLKVSVMCTLRLRAVLTSITIAEQSRGHSWRPHWNHDRPGEAKKLPGQRRQARRSPPRNSLGPVILSELSASAVFSRLERYAIAK